jgi:hypothetical protein
VFRAALFLAAIVAFPFGDLPEIHGQSDGASEYAVKAGFLYNFAKFIEWPADSFASGTAPISFCVFGRDPFGDSLDEIVRGKAINNRGFEIRRTNKLDELKGCQLIFISASEDGRFSQILESLKGTSSLVVGDSEDFAERGGAIAFFFEGNKVHFSVNVDAIKRARLELSSKLLALARIAHDADRPKGTE